MTPKEAFDLLVLLVHRGHLGKEEAESLVAGLKNGADLEELLVEELGKDREWVARMIRTRAGEIPEIPGYEILGRVGTGGTADVFRARETRTNRLLALKVLNPESTRNGRTLKAFVREAKLLERLRHPGLVEGYGVARKGEGDGFLYFSRMELVDGQTLLEVLDQGKALEEAPALRILLEVSEVLRYLHGEGVVHRDVKPGNIMLSGAGKVKLIDLGFAAEEEAPDAAPADTTVGTVAYLSPEQARGQAGADLRSDIYALGVTLFHLVVGRLPFEGSDDRDTLRRQIMESLSSPELKGRRLSPHLHYFVEKMMAKDLDARYQSWEELIEDIQGQLRGKEGLDYHQRSSSRHVRRRRPPSDRRR
jgi:serine/threonine-protein kinase